MGEGGHGLVVDRRTEGPGGPQRLEDGTAPAPTPSPPRQGLVDELALYDGVVNDPSFVLGAGSDQGVLWGDLIEIITALTGIGTAVAVYPVIKRHGPGRAAGFIASRTLEAATIFVGVLAVLAVYTLRQDGGDAATLTTTAKPSLR